MIIVIGFFALIFLAAAVTFVGMFLYSMCKEFSFAISQESLLLFSMDIVFYGGILIFCYLKYREFRSLQSKNITEKKE